MGCSHEGEHPRLLSLCCLTGLLVSPCLLIRITVDESLVEVFGKDEAEDGEGEDGVEEQHEDDEAAVEGDKDEKACCCRCCCCCCCCLWCWGGKSARKAIMNKVPPTGEGNACETKADNSSDSTQKIGNKTGKKLLTTKKSVQCVVFLPDATFLF